MRCWIGLGGNQGDVARTFHEAIARLSESGGLTDVVTSPLFRTAPMGADAGTEFLNAVAGFDTALSPLELLDILQAVERDGGRVRTVPWGPRTLDLDLLYYGDLVIHEPRLTVPHPGVWCRRFVLDPLSTVAADWQDPEWQMTVTELRGRLLHQPPTVTVFGDLDDAVVNTVSEMNAAWQIRRNDEAAARRGGVVVQIGAADSPLVPRLRVAAAQASMARLIIDTATAAFDTPLPASGGT